MSDTNAELPGMLEQARFMFLRMADAMLSAHVLIAGVAPAVIAQADALKADGWRVGLEIFADERGDANVLLTAVSRDGVRRVLAPVAEAAMTGVVN